MKRFDSRKWIIENKYGKLPEVYDEDPFDKEEEDPKNPMGIPEIEKDPDAQVAAAPEGGEGEECNGIPDSGEPAEEDFDGNGEYTIPPNYDFEHDLYVWDSGIKTACDNCTELRIKGEPAIDNIKKIIMGVVNNSENKIYGKVLVNELRMTGVKKSREQEYSIHGKLDFADLMTIEGDYVHKDAGFHQIQKRLGEGDSRDYYHTKIRLNTNIILPAQWGVKTTINLDYSNTILTPKY